MKTEHGRDNLVCAGSRWFFTCRNYMQLSIQICIGLRKRALCASVFVHRSWYYWLLRWKPRCTKLWAALLKNFPSNSSDLLFRHWLFFKIYLLPPVVFHLVSVIQMEKGPLCCRCCIFILLLLRFAVYFLCNVFSSSLHLFTFVKLHLLATFSLYKIKSYKQPCIQIIRSKYNIINVKLVAWTLIKYATRCSPTQGWCLTLGAFKRRFNMTLLINLLARNGQKKSLFSKLIAF